jgi:hypothetical protein
MSDVTTGARTDDLLALVRGRFYLEHQLSKIDFMLHYYDLPMNAQESIAAQVRNDIIEEFWGGVISSPLAMQTEKFLGSSSASSDLANEISDLLGIQPSELYALRSEVEKSMGSDENIHPFLLRKITEVASRTLRSLAVDEVRNKLEVNYQYRLRQLETISQELEAKNIDLLRMLHLTALGLTSAIPVKVYAERCTGVEYDGLIRAVEDLVERLGFSEKLNVQGVK